MSAVTIGDVQSLQTLTVHTSDVTTVDFAGDCILVTGSGDKRVRVWQWRATRGYVEAYFSPLLGHKYGVTSVKVSPRSTMLASASIDGTTLLWNLRTGSKIYTMVQVGGEAVRVCRFSPDSSLLVTAGDNGQVCLWDLVRRSLIKCFQKHDGAIQSVCFSPDSSWLITTCTFGVLKLFSTADIIDSSISNNQSVTAFAWVDDAHDLGVVSCDVSTFQEVTSNEPFTQLYQLVTCGNDHCVKLWEVTAVQAKCEASFTAQINICRIMEKHSSALTCVRFSANGLYIGSSGLDKTAVIWETSTGRIMATLSGHNRYVACCAFSRDGSLLATGSNDKSVIVWDLTGSLCLDSELARCTAPMLFLDEESVKHERDVMRNAETSINDVRLIQRLEDQPGVINSVAFYGNHLIASGSGDKLVRVWSVEMNEDESSDVTMTFQEKPYSPLDGHTYSINYVEFSPCGSMLASCSLDGTAIIWNTEDGCQIKSSFVNSGSGVRVSRWSPDGTKIATAGDDERTTLWDVSNMTELCVYRGHSDAVNAIAFTHDSRYLVTTCNGGTWMLFDSANDKYCTALMVCEEAHDLGVQGCDFSPTDNFMIAGKRTDRSKKKQSYLLATSGNDSLVKLWQITIYKQSEITSAGTGSSDGNIRYEEKKTLTGHGGNVTCVRFSPNQGEILGSVATDRTARIWSVYSGACLFVLEEHESLVTTCAFSDDTSLFITGGLDRTILIWTIPQRLISQNALIDNLRHNRHKVADWRVDDTLKWLNEIGLSMLTEKAYIAALTGRQLLTISEDDLIKKLQIEQDEQAGEAFKTQLYWLKREDSNAVEVPIDGAEIPHEFLCPITHEIMKEPVLCSDGFTYERAAINEWFLCGKYTSPMTNKSLQDTSLSPNIVLRNTIYTFLHGNRPQS
ncbi:WD repeat, SAM and U-box domain-containing protein 1-like [Colletes gigas]|uniref:WD repeat, SAM and U-box domain-containing protein 1-like n=1 Tax=Colletes gigas TaxID=935657 RepID=UPI001C9AC916|nr:WD repeat, SAM and U-box domain-containing protein 1-like [Colletes gigas]XP_043263893.1 WD repeat, SAM and U-box domain-containing protein 1-like [Colletes gigas]